MQYEVEVGGRLHQVRVRHADGRFSVAIGEAEWTIDAVRVDPHRWSLLVEYPAALDREAGAASGPSRIVSHEIIVVPDRAPGRLNVHVGALLVPVGISGLRLRTGRRDARPDAGTGPERIVAPMPGKIVRVLVERGAAVSAGQPVVVIEAMKMENELRAGRDGIAAEIAVEPGQSVEAGTLLMVVAGREWS